TSVRSVNPAIPETAFYGNNSDPVLPDHVAAIAGGATKGLWYYGHIKAGQANAKGVYWSFDNPDADFTFSGQLFGDVAPSAACTAPGTETAPSLAFGDENCDGIDGVNSDTDPNRGALVDPARG